MSNTGLYDSESQDLILIILHFPSTCQASSKRLCNVAKSSSHLISYYCLLLFCTSLLKLECDGNTFPSFCAFQLCSTKLLVQRHSLRRYAGGKMKFQDPVLRNKWLLKPWQSKSQDDICAVKAPLREQPNIIHVLPKAEKNSWVVKCSG